MQRIIIYIGFCGVSFAQSPTEKALMLPSPVRLAGIVDDNRGQPLGDVWINHTGVRIENIRTDAQGHFDIKTRAPAIVFRKDGFESKYLRVSGEALGLAITLEPSTNRARACTSSSRCISLKGFMSWFCLPKVKGVNVTKQNNDVDYGQRVLWVTTQAGQEAIQHAAGGMWGDGWPLDQDVWSAVNYTETSYVDPDGFLIIDARGNSPDGTYWRVLGHAFETASYRHVSKEAAAILDRVLDGVCVQKLKLN